MHEDILHTTIFRVTMLKKTMQPTPLWNDALYSRTCTGVCMRFVHLAQIISTV